MQYNKTAIIVLDIQNDFCDSSGAFATHLGWDPKPIQAMVPRLVQFIERARTGGALIIFSQMINNGTESPANLKEVLSTYAERTAEKWPFGLVRGSWGWELYKVRPQENDVILEKKYYDFFSNERLKEILDDCGITTLIITGLYTEVCVLSTALRGFTEGYEIIVPRSLTASVAHRSVLREASLEILQGYAASVPEGFDL